MGGGTTQINGHIQVVSLDEPGLLQRPPVIPPGFPIGNGAQVPAAHPAPTAHLLDDEAEGKLGLRASRVLMHVLDQSCQLL